VRQSWRSPGKLYLVVPELGGQQGAKSISRSGSCRSNPQEDSSGSNSHRGHIQGAQESGAAPNEGEADVPAFVDEVAAGCQLRESK